MCNLEPNDRSLDPSRIYTTVDSLLEFTRDELLEMNNQNSIDINSIIAQLDKADTALATRNDHYDRHWYIKTKGALRAKRSFQQRVNNALSLLKEKQKKQNIQQRAEVGVEHLAHCGYAVAFVEAAKLVVSKETYLIIAKLANGILDKKVSIS